MGVLATSCKWKPEYNLLELILSSAMCVSGMECRLSCLVTTCTGPGFCISVYSLLVTAESSLQIQS